MVRRKDPFFWDHVKTVEGGFICNYCSRKFSGGVPRIRSHLSGVKGGGIDICGNVPDDVKAEAELAIGSPSKKGKTVIASTDLENDQAASAPSYSFSENLHQNLMPEMHKKDKNVVDKRLAKFIISNNIPFDVVEAPSFLDFVKGVAEYGLDYKLPSSLTLQTKFVPELEMEVEAYVKNVKKSWATTGCTILLDVQCNVMNVMAYSSKGAIFVRSFDISTYSEDEMGVSVSSTVEDLGLDNVVPLITNNCKILDLVGDILINRCPRLYMIRCVAHEIHCLLKDIYDQVEWIQVIIDDAKLIVEHMYEDSSALSLLKAYTGTRELKLPSASKFASNCQMLQSILDNENELRQLAASLEGEALDCSKKERGMKVCNIVRSPEFWSQGREVLKSLEPIIQVLCLVEDDGSTSGYLYQALEKASEAIKSNYSNDPSRNAKILELFAERQSNNLIHPIHAAAAFLNPAYMCHEDFIEDQKMKDGIQFMWNTLVADEDRTEFLKELQLYRSKVSDLFTQMANKMIETSHPRVWWEYCGDRLPILKRHAIQILSQPCKCSWECIASKVVQTRRMSKETPGMQDKLAYVTINSMLMENFRSLEERCLEPIDIRKCHVLPDYIDLKQLSGKDWTGLSNEVHFPGFAADSAQCFGSPFRAAVPSEAEETQCAYIDSPADRNEAPRNQTEVAVDDSEGCARVLKVVSLRAWDIHGISEGDVYAKLYLTNDPETSVVSYGVIHGSNVVFWPLNLRRVRSVDCSLKCEIYDRSRTSNCDEDKLLGVILVPLSELRINNCLEKDFCFPSSGFFQIALRYEPGVDPPKDSETNNSHSNVARILSDGDQPVVTHGDEGESRKRKAILDVSESSPMNSSPQVSETGIIERKIVRRGKINERFRLLQDIVPGCYKARGTAVILDEIIHYVQSLHKQVEFLSMKLAAARTFYDFNAEPDVIGTMQRANAQEAQEMERFTRHGYVEGLMASSQLGTFDFYSHTAHEDALFPTIFLSTFTSNI